MDKRLLNQRVNAGGKLLGEVAHVIICAALLVVGLSLAGSASAQQHLSARPAEAWREAYQSSPAATDLTTDAEFDAFAQRLKMPPQIADHVRPKHVTGTIRYRLIVSAGGRQVRLRLSNEAGIAPLQLSDVSVGIAGTAFDARPHTLKPVSFGGKSGITIPAGAPALSDPVDLAVQPGTSLLVSVHGPETFILTGNGASALAVSPGAQTMAESLNSATPMGGRPIVSGISVLAPATTRTVVTLGDSITDGNRPDIAALHSWPEQLARRLAERKGRRVYGVANAGISGNRLLGPGLANEMGISGLARLERDVLRVDGLSHIVVLEGTNDIGTSGHTMFGDNPPVTADDLIMGYRQIISRAHQRGVKVVLATITPFGGSMSHSSPEKELTRQAVNAWIRTSGEPDGVADFDAAIRDPEKPSQMQARFDSGDHLHPNEAGSREMGSAVKLSLFD